MLSYALRRLAMIVPVLLGISIIVFLIMAMIPGDPALAILGSFATPENTAQLRQDLGLDRSRSRNTPSGSATCSRAISAAPTASTAPSSMKCSNA